MTLDDAIDNLYRVFARYPLRPDMPACSCCTPKDDFAVLVSVPLRNLTDVQLEHFAVSAVTTWGDSDDYKHFLPRILELASRPDGGHSIGLEFWLIAEKLKDNDWTNWPTPEQEAIREYLMVLWEEMLSRHKSCTLLSRALTFLRDIAGAVEDVSPYLRKWSKRQDLPALLMLSDFIVQELGGLLQANANWRKHPQREYLVLWFSDPARGQALDAAIERFIDDPRAESLAIGLDFWHSMTRQANA